MTNKQGRLSKTSDIPYKNTARSKREAQAALKAWRDELVMAEASRAEMLSSDMPFGAFVTRFWEVHQHTVKGSTAATMKSRINRVASSSLATIPLCDITPMAVKAFEAELSKKAGPTTVAHYHGFISQILNAAVHDRKIPFNPLSGERAPKRYKKPINALSSAGRAKLIADLETMLDKPFAFAAYIASLTGMRRGEICALRWQDIDLDRKIIHVTNNIGKQADGSFELVTPKDPSGGDATRDIPMTGRAYKALSEKKLQTRKLRKDLGVPWKESLFVLGRELNEKPLNPDTVSRRWAAYADAFSLVGSQGELMTFHDLRHTFATLAVKDKTMDVKTLSSILGHRDAAVTLNMYADDLEEAKRAAMDKLDADLSVTAG